MIVSRRTFILGLSAAVLSGCAVVPDNARVWRGRFSLRTSLNGRSEVQSGRFELTRAPDLLRLDLLTPLSGILARIEETPRGASFARSLDDEPVVRPNMDALLTELLGFTLPVGAMGSLLGEPAIQNECTYGAWRVRILSRLADSSPERLRIEGRADSSAPAVQLTLFVEHQ